MNSSKYANLESCIKVKLKTEISFNSNSIFNKDHSTMEARFNKEFAAFIESKRTSVIPTAAKYEEMIASIQKSAATTSENHGKNTPQRDLNVIRRYSIHIENTSAVLLHQGDGNKEAPQRVVKREELFELLQRTHTKLGHAGVGIMWNDLREYLGISK